MQEIGFGASRPTPPPSASGLSDATAAAPAAARRADAPAHGLPALREVLHEIGRRRRAQAAHGETGNAGAADDAAALAQLPDGVLVEVNDEWVRLFGHARDQALGKTLAELGLHAGGDAWCETVAGLRRDGRVANQVVAPASQGGVARRFLARIEALRIGAQEHLVWTAQDITARRQAELQSNFHSSLLNTVGQAVIATDKAGLITYMNRAAESLYGWDAAEAGGRSILDVTVPQVSQDQARDIMAQLELGRVWAGEFLVQHRDGRVFPAEVHDTPILDDEGGLVGIIGISSDISRRRAIETALELERSKLATVIENSPVGLVMCNAQGGEMSMNATALHLFGYAHAGELHRRIEDNAGHWELCRADGSLIDYADWPLVRAMQGEFVQDLELHCCNLKSNRRWICKLTVAPVHDAAGEVVLLVQTLFDITENKRLEQVLLDRNEQLTQANRVAETASRAKSAFLSSMSHELRSPLHAILGFAQLLDSGTPKPTPEQKSSVDQILQAGWYLLELINEVLDLAMIESGKLSLSLESMALDEVLADCRAMIDPQAQQRGIRVSFPAADAARFVRADRTRVKQVLINLLSNAIKYNRVGGELELSCSADTGGRIRVSVRDGGEGLSEENFAQLFQPFNRLGRQGGASEGTGIGLVVSKRLVELMGGSIGAQSTLGTGSVFWVDLLSAVAPAPEPLLASASAPSVPRAGVAALRTVLCVEDNPANLLLIQRLLSRRADLRLISADNGRRGVELARTARPDLILMDINLPDISGLTALGILAKDPATAHIPVVALSANALARDVKNGLRAGFFRYLTKPLKVTEFMASLDEALEFAATAAKRKHSFEARP